MSKHIRTASQMGPLDFGENIIVGADCEIYKDDAIELGAKETPVTENPLGTFFIEKRVPGDFFCTIYRESTDKTPLTENEIDIIENHYYFNGDEWVCFYRFLTGTGNRFECDPVKKHIDREYNIYEHPKASMATGEYSVATGGGVVAKGKYSHAEGSKTEARGIYSHAEGYNCHANKESSHAEGNNCRAEGKYSHAEGKDCYVSESGEGSHAEGDSCHAFKKGSHAEGYTCGAEGDYSHAEGNNCHATKEGSHAEGRNTRTEGDYSHTEGWNTNTLSKYSHAEGFCTQAGKTNEASSGIHVSGKYNDPNDSDIFQIGCGTEIKRENAFWVNRNGDVNVKNFKATDSITTKNLTATDSITTKNLTATNILDNSKTTAINFGPGEYADTFVVTFTKNNQIYSVCFDYSNGNIELLHNNNTFTHNTDTALG